MKHLLIVLWLLDGGSFKITTADFDTEAECRVTGAILADLRHGDTQARWWACIEEEIV